MIILVRNWKVWHHHEALGLLDLLWIVKLQKHFLEEFKDIPPQDIDMFKIWMPLKVKTSLMIAELIIVTIIGKNHG
ncbi:MAG: hypothetical protein LUQ50_11530 [Methanospirillum sp.]|uniref:hypothetical protein n=1 Tax=Methanospirillum sp. TaxID=45200 RepID=UPI00237008C4|nr:hypothetical protein [Methanospirillum sp.]MDD1729685.1 hypothetical protein [Methanospirillum sp.]